MTKYLLGNVIDRILKAYSSYKADDILRQLGSHGDNCALVYPFNIAGAGNIYLDDYVSIGKGVTLYTTRARLIIKSHVIFGPNVTIITGDHQAKAGRYVDSITDDEKDVKYDQDVVIEDDVWVGANVTILKGVTIGRSSIISAGAVVTKSTPPYSVSGGVPAKVIKYKWAHDEICFHEKFLNEK